jgi:hypothetical protein
VGPSASKTWCDSELQSHGKAGDLLDLAFPLSSDLTGGNGSQVSYAEPALEVPICATWPRGVTSAELLIWWVRADA